MQVSDLRGILEYIPRFRERTFVIAIDGEIIESENFSNLLLDLAVLRSLNIQVVIVHGASHQIAQRAAGHGRRGVQHGRLRHHRRGHPPHQPGGGQPPHARDHGGPFLRGPARRVRQRHHRLSGGHPARRGPALHRQGGTRGRQEPPAFPRPGHGARAAAPGLRRRRQNLPHQLRHSWPWRSPRRCTPSRSSSCARAAACASAANWCASFPSRRRRT